MCGRCEQTLCTSALLSQQALLHTAVQDGLGFGAPKCVAYEDWVDEPLRKVCFLDRSTAQNPQNPIEQRNGSPTDATKPVGTRWWWRGQIWRNWLVFDFNEEPPYLTQNRLSFFPGEKSKFVCENAVTSGGGTDWVDTGARRGWCLFGRGGNNLREPGPLNYLHNHCRRGEYTTSSYFLPSFWFVTEHLFALPKCLCFSVRLR